MLLTNLINNYGNSQKLSRFRLGSDIIFSRFIKLEIKYRVNPDCSFRNIPYSELKNGCDSFGPPTIGPQEKIVPVHLVPLEYLPI